MIVVAIIGLLAAIAIPNFVKARATSQKNTCISNLHQIDAAIQEFALEHHTTSNTVVAASDIQPYLGRGPGGTITNIVCPADSAQTFDTSYTIVDVATAPVCRIAPSTHILY